MNLYSLALCLVVCVHVCVHCECVKRLIKPQNVNFPLYSSVCNLSFTWISSYGHFKRMVVGLFCLKQLNRDKYARFMAGLLMLHFQENISVSYNK